MAASGSIAVLHTTYRSVGGAERLSLAVIMALKRAGFSVELHLLREPDWPRIRRLAPDFYVEPDRLVVHGRFPLDWRVARLYEYVLMAYYVKLSLRRKNGIVFNTHGDVLPYPGDIVYLHYPVFIPEATPFFERRGRWYRLYILPYKILLKPLIKQIKTNTKLLLTNSKYSLDRIREFLGLNAKILYPPVPTRAYRAITDAASTKRKKHVVTVGRFSPEKNYEIIIEIASKLEETRFYVVGSVATKVSKAYLAKLQRIAREKRVANVTFLPNLPQQELLKIMRESSVYLHTMEWEPFGISVVEAMAAGLIPVVPKHGGPWTDIIEEGKYGFGYSSIDEAVQAIREALEASNSLRRTIIERASQFSLEKFIENLIYMLDSENLLPQKQHATKAP